MQKSLEHRGQRALPTSMDSLQTSSVPPTITPILPPSLSMPLQLSANNPSTASHALLLPAPPLLPGAPEDMQVCVRTPRAERVTTSCSECRRRKQKCDQGRPCGNCVKRYPQPLCEYKQNKRRNPAVPREPAFKVVLPAQDYDYAKFSGIRNPMLPPAQQRRRQHRPNTFPPAAHGVSLTIPNSLPSPPLQSPPLLSTTHSVPSQTHFIADALDQQPRHQQQFQQQQQQQQQQWGMFTTAAAAAGNVVLGADPVLDRWQGLDLMATDDYTDELVANMRMPMTDTPMPGRNDGGGGMPTLFDPSHDPNFGGPFPPTAFPIQHYGEGGHDGDGGSNNSPDHGMFLLNLDHAVILHHDVLSDAFQLLQARHSISNELLASSGRTSTNAASMDDFYAWLRILTWTAPGHYGHGNSGGGGGRGRSRSRNGSQSSTSSGHSLPGTNLFQITGPAADLAHLPLEATRLNADLVRIYVKLISRFKSCLDGNPDPTNPYTRIYVPYCLQTPLLAQVAIYTSACFLHETGHLDKMVAVTHKGRAIDMLNAQLQRSSSNSGDGGPVSTSTSDDAITAVIQLVMDEWYWGQTQNLHAHLRGLREMIRLRGGLRNLGMNGLVSKLAMASDLAIALSLEMTPILQGSNHSSSSSLFDCEDVSPAPFRVAHNTPLVSGRPSFAQCAEPLDIHPTTASILDDMRFLIAAVLALPTNPTAKDLQKVQTTAEWIHDRIQRLPADSPELPETNEGENMLSTEVSGMADRRPSIVLSQAEPHQQADMGFATQSSLFLDQHQQPQQRQSSASPRSLARHRGQSGSPHPAQPSPTPPGSADGSLLSMSMSANNSRSGSAFNSRRGSAHSVGHMQATGASSGRQIQANQANQPPWSAATVAPPPATAASSPPLLPPVMDPLYQAVRQTALVYARAVLQRRPFSQVVEPHEFVQLWTATWRVSLTTWKGLLGVFMWVTLSIIGSARDTPHDLFVKSMLSICTVQMSLESWDVAAGALKAAVRLNAWLGGGANGNTGGNSQGDGVNGSRRRAEQQFGLARTATDGGSGVAGFSTTEHHGLRDSGATLPGWNP